jgi:hypothetical protein
MFCITIKVTVLLGKTLITTNYIYYETAKIKTTVFWDVAPCCLVEIYRRLEVLVASVISAMMEAASSSETSVNFYQTTRRNIPEDHLHTRRRENLKSHLPRFGLESA